MKKFVPVLFVFFLVLVMCLNSGCSSTVNNSITFKNLSASDLYINFRGEVITVPAGQTSIVKEIPKGQYTYATTYSVPSSASNSSEQGDLAGTVKITAGTKILVLYSSAFINNVYYLSATLSNSDDQSTTSGTTNP